MTLETVMDKTRLSAYADGELSPEEAAKVVMHLVDHPQDQAYVDELMAANEALLQAFSTPLNEPVPAAIEETITGKPAPANVIPFRRKAVAWAGGMALAASVALTLVALPEILAPGDDRMLLTPGPVSEGSVLARALDRLPSGTPEDIDGDRKVMILATLPVEGGFCREIEVVDPAEKRIDLSVACNEGEGWTVAVTMSEPLSATGTEDGFVAASGTEVQSLGPHLERLGAGLALDAATEADVIKRGWKPE